MLVMQGARDALGISDLWILYGKRPCLSVHLQLAFVLLALHRKDRVQKF